MCSCLSDAQRVLSDGIFPSGSHPSSLTSSQVSPGSTGALPPQPLRNNPALIAVSNQPPLRCQNQWGPFSHSLPTGLIEIVRLVVNPFSPKEYKLHNHFCIPMFSLTSCNYLLTECILPLCCQSTFYILIAYRYPTRCVVRADTALLVGASLSTRP